MNILLHIIRDPVLFIFIKKNKILLNIDIKFKLNISLLVYDIFLYYHVKFLLNVYLIL